MKTTTSTKISSNKGLLLVPLFSEDLKKLPASLPQPVREFIGERVKDGDFKGKKEETVFTYFKDKKFPGKCLLLGMGERDKFRNYLARDLGAQAAKVARRHKCAQVTVAPADFDHLCEFFEGMLLAQYHFTTHKTKLKKEDKPVALEAVDFVTNGKNSKLGEELKRHEIIVNGVDFVKELVNQPSNVVDGEYMAKAARTVARENGFKIAVLTNKDLKKMGAGGILAVNQGTKKEAYLLVLQYDGGPRSEKPAVLIGKGVIFDTGGYNLKPTGSIETMQQDMGGAATVLGLFKILKKLKVKKNVIAVMPVVENLISSTAYRPSDIITMLNGRTVEITNTDAEGRLILADAITYAAKLDPKFMITVATLTGAVGVSLGNRYCGILGDKDLTAGLQKAGDEVDDLAWTLPIHNDYRDKMKSSIADLRNYDLGTGRYGGTLKAAAFLEKFTDKKKWAHIDIGGTAFTDDPKPYEVKGATAHSFRMLLKFLSS